MCQFCVQHGDGKRWYLEASNYAFDLSADLGRRRYMVDFIRDFDANRSRLVTGLGLLDAMPAPIRTFGKARVSAALERSHFGQPVPLEDAERVFDVATSIVRLPCPCRTFSGASEEGYCLAITTQPVEDILAEGFADYASGPDVSAFQRITKEEALAQLRRCEDEGLMHSVWTFQTPFIGAMCNCDLKSGCMAMRVTREFGTKIMWKGEHIAEVDADACIGCRECVGHCPFGAIAFDDRDRRANVSVHDCYGCGVCRAACSADAISLHDRRSDPAVANDW